MVLFYDEEEDQILQFMEQLKKRYQASINVFQARFIVTYIAL